MRTMKAWFVIALCLVAIGTLTPTTLAQGPIAPVADTYTDAIYYDYNFGSEENTFLSGGSATGCSADTYLWFKYDIPETLLIEDASLSLTFNTLGSGVSDLELRSSTDATWDELAITWEYQPAFDPIVLATVTGAAPGGTVAFQSTTFTDYLNDHTGETVSLIVLVDCDGTVGPSVALAVATKENPGGAAALLDLTFPTAVTLTAFTATSVPGAIRLDWETASEAGLLGFNLYRAPSPASTPEKLNASLVLAHGASDPYRYIDSTARAGNTYYYWIDLVNTNGLATRFGPQSATAGFYRTYLPLVKR